MSTRADIIPAMSGLLHISVVEHPAGRVYRLRGSLDAANTPPLDQIVNELLQTTVGTAPAPGTPVSAPAPLPVSVVVFDLSEVDLLGSLAIGAFIRLHRGMTLRHGSLKLATLTSAVHTSMKHARLDRFFEIYDSVEAALGEII